MSTTMTQHQFDLVLDRRLAKIKEVLSAKGNWYRQDGDRLHSFNGGARVKGITAEQALDGMMLKHYVAYQAMIATPQEFTEKQIDETMGDIINYFILQEAIMRARAGLEVPDDEKAVTPIQVPECDMRADSYQRSFKIKCPGCETVITRAHGDGYPVEPYSPNTVSVCKHVFKCLTCGHAIVTTSVLKDNGELVTNV